MGRDYRQKDKGYIVKNIYSLFDKGIFIQKGKEDLVYHITNNTKDIKKNSVFFAVEGTKTDGHIFVEEAVEKGAVCIVSDNKAKAVNIKNRFPDISVVLVDNIRKSQAIVAQKFYNYPDRDLKIIGITGTNGKTSTAHITAQFLKNSGFKVATIGTIGYEFEGKYFGGGMTTPDSIKWYSLLHTFKSLGVDYIVSEISSHAVSQYRVYGTKFYGGIFTNLTQDHLDYHKDMKSYFETKKSFIDYVLENNSLSRVSINIDCDYGMRIYQQSKFKDRIITYGYKSDQFKILSSSMSMKGTVIDYIFNGKKGIIKTNLLGEFNVYNLCASFSLLLSFGFKQDVLEKIAPNIKPIKGRFEIVSNNGFLVINDYAHTPDALEKILKSLSLFKKGRIISVFGAGGDRDKTKRPIMGMVAQKYSDIIILTSDNPRSEKAEDIIQDILKGITQKDKVIIVVDREMAIKKAIQLAKENDIILIAGKGHETYQIIGDRVFKFDDSDIARKYIKK